jgi:hypothetical protein
VEEGDFGEFAGSDWGADGGGDKRGVEAVAAQAF